MADNESGLDLLDRVDGHAEVRRDRLERADGRAAVRARLLRRVQIAMSPRR
jgi:hypothetical protein